MSFLRWVLYGSFIGILSGSAAAFFLVSLDYVTNVRLENPWLLFLLPLGGAFVSYLYWKWGKNSSKGNNLILEQINNTEQESIPLRMAPLVLFGTLVTHLFGGSAGREGTAVQMGGSLAEWFGKLIRVHTLDRRILLICGISGGFGSVFGTPIAGAVFGLEVFAVGRIRHEALLPAFAASFVGHVVVTSLWGVAHLQYQIGIVPQLSWIVLIKVGIAAILFGWTSVLFSVLTHNIKKLFSRFLSNPMLRSAAGGLVIIGLVYVIGTRDYLGLGLNLIQDSFQEVMNPLDFLWKILFTALTLGAGFQGGEVTPLFSIGASLGSTLAGLLNLYAPFLAALGLISVFCGATKTPIACFLLGIELFGSEAAVYMFMACLISYVASGKRGIYSSQRLGD